MPNTSSYASLTRRYAKYSVAGVMALLALVVLVIGGKPDKAEAAPVSCPKFQVMHNDKIGNVTFPAGYYAVTLLNGDKLTCAQSTKLFQQFLQDWDGKLQSPWKLTQSGNTRTFKAGNTDKGFTATPSNSGGGGGGGNSGASCPGYFTVVHNDSIGSFKVPRGQYRITLNSKQLSCSQAVKLFQEFLLDFDGKLPSPWRLSQASATFYKATNPQVGFKINKAYGPSPNPNNNHRYSRCPATFTVLHNDRIGGLQLPKGPYYIYVVNGLSCSSASNYFREFLNRTDGRLPAPWQLSVAKARFGTGAGGMAFRVQHA